MSHTVYLRCKRALDIGGVVLVLPLVVPVGLAVALAVRRRLGSPVLFRQRRIGKHGQVFTLVKFRTMRDTRGPDGHPRPDAERLTPFGAWLRATSLDELPSLWNVLIGEMSLVGPRPLRADYAGRFTAQEWRRHDVLPGLTGLAQVRSRNATTWEARFADDLAYVDRASMGLDLRLFLATLGAVASRRGVAHPSEATMPELRPAEERDVDAVPDPSPVDGSSAAAQ